MFDRQEIQAIFGGLSPIVEAIAIKAAEIGAEKAIAHLSATTKADPAQTERYLPVAEAAKLLGLAPQTIYQKARKIPHLKRHGRLYFIERDLHAYLEAGRQV